MNASPIKPFPIPVVAALGPGSQPEDEALDYLPMPQGMQTYRAPQLPEPEELAGHDGALVALRATLAALHDAVGGHPAAPIDLGGLTPRDRQLINQVLGEGEVSAQSLGAESVQVQESVFAGVWRVLRSANGCVTSDTIEVGAIPEGLRRAARDDGRDTGVGVLPEAMPEGVMNAPSLLAEIDDQQRRWRHGQAPHIINMTLLPLTPQDSVVLDRQLGAGRVRVLSRGYGNCRITNTCVPNTWRVVYFNSQDAVILDTIEVSDMPEVACAAREDLADSAERLTEVLAWVAAS